MARLNERVPLLGEGYALHLVAVLDDLDFYEIGLALYARVWGAYIRSGVVLRGDRVFVDEAAKPVVPADRSG